ncbi:potassium channel family protein [Mycobacterium sp. smrl_JER01]|uniref:potassium channel family protein n=1 Tax=Mycobacterium sp. smrl_JER01 TaxID=3402633 RepID=UPI003ACE8148
MRQRPKLTLQQWEKRSEWPLAGVALVFLVTYSIQVLAQPPAPVGGALQLLNTVLYIAFVADYLIRLALADRRWRWFVRHLLDLAIVALPFLRPLRLLRLVVLISAMHRAAGDAIRGRVAMYTVGGSILLIYVASLAVLDAERHAPGAEITSFGDALWWAMTTVTTVGYGDLAPVTTTGRVVAALLMVGGISLLGVVTATLASWIVQRVAEEDTANQAATAAQIDALRAEVRRLYEAQQRRDQHLGHPMRHTEPVSRSTGTD